MYMPFEPGVASPSSSGWSANKDAASQGEPAITGVVPDASFSLTKYNQGGGKTGSAQKGVTSF